MRFHLLALAHTQTTRAFSVCAFTSLARQKADMMTDLGHEVVLYASEDNDAKCSEHVVCIKKSEQARLCGIEKPTDVLRASWEPTSPHWAVFSARIIDALEARLQPEDIILVSAGWSLSPVIERFQQHTRVEYAVGYTGWHEQTHRVLPSYAWQHTLMGKWYGSHGTRGRFSDRVIPHWVDPAEFPEPKTKAGGDYLLFVGTVERGQGSPDRDRHGQDAQRPIGRRRARPPPVARLGESDGSRRARASRATHGGSRRCVCSFTLLGAIRTRGRGGTDGRHAGHHDGLGGLPGDRGRRSDGSALSVIRRVRGSRTQDVERTIRPEDDSRASTCPVFYRRHRSAL
jgi:hypothetical protein